MTTTTATTMGTITPTAGTTTTIPTITIIRTTTATIMARPLRWPIIDRVNCLSELPE
jgi:hypothetical protein